MGALVYWRASVNAGRLDAARLIRLYRFHHRRPAHDRGHGPGDRRGNDKLNGHNESSDVNVSPTSTPVKICQAFASHGQPQDAREMQRYMRDLFPFFGIKTVQRRALVKANSQKSNSWEQLAEWVDELYAQPQREAHYAALDLLEANPKVWRPEVVPLLERLVLTHSWWDTIDRIASPLVPKAFSLFPELADRPEAWTAHEGFWMRRVALLYQRTAGPRTNTDRLSRYIEATMDSPEFFLRKAIGWALRQYGYTDPQWVRQFVETHRARLSPLSIREGTRALKSQVS
jgi:3-methyladenine DNA glycosylase AlkD